jgi:putative MATE family efflux protein
LAIAAQQPQVIDLHRDHLTRTILRLSIPSVAESILTTMVYLVDTILIGWLGNPAVLAAVGLSGTLLWTADGLFQAISISASAMVARHWGEKDFERARTVSGQVLTVSVFVAGIMMAVLIPTSRAFLRLMGGEPEVVLRGTEYVSIILATSLVSFPLTVANSIMRATGDTQKPMYITGLMNVVNAVLAYMLVFGLGPIPRLELRGAALATSLARTLGGIGAQLVLFSGRTPIHLRLRHLRHWDWGLIRRLVRLSLPNIGETLISRLGFMLFTRILSSLGTVALAANQVALRVESIAYMPAWGLATAAAALVGQALGAKKEEMAQLGIRRTLVMGNAAMAVLAGAFVAGGAAIVRLFGIQDAGLAGSAAAAVRISALELCGLCSVMILSGCLRGAGDTRTPMVVTLAGTVLFRVPVTYLFAISLHGGLRGIWLATAVDWSMRALIMFMFYMRGRWKVVPV